MIGLVAHFAEVNVSVVDCPNLQEEPFFLAGKGLSGDAKIADVGGPP